MNDQQNINNTFINNQPPINSQLNRKQFDKLKNAKKSLLIAGIFAIVWFICFVVFIILLNVSVVSTTDTWIMSLNNTTNTPALQSFTNTGTWIVAIVFISIGAFMVLGCVIFGIMALIKIFAINKEVDTSPINVNYNMTYGTYDIRSSLSTTKYLGLVGVILCPIYIGIILLWVSNVRLSQIIRRVGPTVQ